MGILALVEGQRQVHDKGGADAFLAVDGDAAAVLLHHLPHGADRDKVWDLIPEAERRPDPEKKGTAMLIKLGPDVPPTPRPLRRSTWPERPWRRRRPTSRSWSTIPKGTGPAPTDAPGARSPDRR